MVFRLGRRVGQGRAGLGRGLRLGGRAAAWAGRGCLAALVIGQPQGAAGEEGAHLRPALRSFTPTGFGVLWIRKTGGCAGGRLPMDKPADGTAGQTAGAGRSRAINRLERLGRAMVRMGRAVIRLGVQVHAGATGREAGRGLRAACSGRRRLLSMGLLAALARKAIGAEPLKVRCRLPTDFLDTGSRPIPRPASRGWLIALLL